MVLGGCGGADPPPRGATAGARDRPSRVVAAPAQSAAEIAEWLLTRYGLENQIPMIRDELLSKVPEIEHAQRDRLIEFLTEELERELRPKMVELCVESFTLDELRALRAGRETPEIGEAFSRWATASEQGLEAWCADLLEAARRRLEEK